MTVVSIARVIAMMSSAALDEIHRTVILVNFYDPAGQHIQDLLLLIVLNYKPSFCTKDCPIRPFLRLQEWFLLAVYKYLVHVQFSQFCSRNSLELTETDRFTLQNVNHALKHTNSTYQLGCMQPVGIFGSV